MSDRLVCTSILIVLVLGSSVCLLVEMDQATFRRMWEMSETGHPAEHCFLRLPQTEYYHEKRDNEGTTNPLHTMPDVNMFRVYLGVKVLNLFYHLCD